MSNIRCSCFDPKDNTCSNPYSRRRYEECEEHKQLQVQLTETINALQSLYDEQNGPPLIRDKERWQEAMDEAGRLLVKHKDLIAK